MQTVHAMPIQIPMKRILVTCFLACIGGIAAERYVSGSLLQAYAQNSRQLTESGSSSLGVSAVLAISGIIGIMVGGALCALAIWYLGAAYSRKRLFGYALAAAICFLIGAVRCHDVQEMPQDLEQLDGEWIQGRGILEQVTEKEGSVTLLLRQIELEEPYSKKLDCKLYGSVKGEGSPDSDSSFDTASFREKARPGQVVCFEGELMRYSEATNPGEFDYRKYCWSLGIGGQVSLKENQVQFFGTGSWFRYALQKLHFFLKERLLLLAQPSDAGILICLLTGDKSELDAYWKDLYGEASILHLLSLSGLHVGILGMGLFRLLRKLVGSFLTSSLLSGFFMVAFCIMTGSGTSMVRAMICFLLFLLAGYTGRSYDLPTAASAAGILLLWEHPLLLFEAGFLMTFSCVMGIGYLLPLGELIFIENREDDEPWRKTLGKFQKSLLSAALLQLSSLPAVLWFQGSASLAGPIINLLTVPLMDFVLISDLLAVSASFLFLNLGVFLLGAAHYILSWYETVCLVFQRAPFLQIVTGRPHGWQIFLWGLLLAGGLLWRYQELIWKQKKSPFWIGMLLFPCTLFLLQRAPSHAFSIQFLDVGQGDGIVLELPDGQGIFCIDGGSSSRSKLEEYVYEPYFAFAGIEEVDGWLITHPDSDHYSGMLALLEDGFSIHHIFMAEQFQGSELAAQIEALHPIDYITAGNQMKIGDLQLEFLHPASSYPATDGNAASAAVYVTWNGFSALFTGDVSQEAEPLLIERLDGRKVDLLKVAHHGSKTATSQEFLEKIAPTTAIISCGASNRYGHPHQEVLERLEREGISVYRTDQLGAIQVICRLGEEMDLRSITCTKVCFRL